MGEPVQSRLVRFGPFQADLREGELRKQGRKLKIQEQPFQVLAALLERRGEIVSREELRQRIWPDEFVEFEHSLNVAVNKLREALADSAERPRYIETVPRHGYRFVAAVAPVERRRWPRWLAAAAIVLAVAAGIGGIFFRPQQREPRAVRFTSLLGVESYATISPDGKMVAFCWTGEKETYVPVPSSIYVQQVGSETALRRTYSPTHDFSPAWSRDSPRIAFCRLVGEETLKNTGFTIHVMDALSGPEFEVGRSLAGHVESWWVIRRLAWSPDGKVLAVVDTAPGDQSSSIYSLSVQTRERRRLTTPPASFVGDFAPAFSPDGRTLAFIRKRSLFADDVYLLPLNTDGVSDGKPQRMTPRSKLLIEGLDWTADGRSIVFATGGDLWRIPASGGDLRRLNVGDRVGHPSVSREGDRLVYVTRDQDADLQRVPGPNAAGAKAAGEQRSPERRYSSTAWDTWPKYSPDGKQVVFVSGRGGAWRIWRCDSDDSKCMPLTSVPGGWPRWSPDGQFIAFTSGAEEDPGNLDIFRVSAKGGEPRRLTFHNAQDDLASWSKDGRRIYFGSNRGGDWQIWRMPSEGGTAAQVTKNGGYEAFESADGRLLYYAKRYPTRGIWRVPVGGGAEIQVLDHGEETYWELLEDGICFLANPGIVKFFRFSTRRIETVHEFPKGTGFNGFAVSPDGQWVLCALAKRFERDIMLVENFR